MAHSPRPWPTHISRITVLRRATGEAIVQTPGPASSGIVETPGPVITEIEEADTDVEWTRV